MSSLSKSPAGKTTDLFPLATAWGPHGPDVINSINAAKTIVFQMIGDSGATATKTFGSMIKVSDAVTSDFHTSNAANRPSFLFHLGDVVYNFGDGTTTTTSSTSPIATIPRPSSPFPAITIPSSCPESGSQTSLSPPSCASSVPPIVVTKEAGSLHRTSMMQPGVYFALDAPFAASSDSSAMPLRIPE